MAHSIWHNSEWIWETFNQFIHSSSIFTEHLYTEHTQWTQFGAVKAAQLARTASALSALGRTAAFQSGLGCLQRERHAFPTALSSDKGASLGTPQHGTRHLLPTVLEDGENARTRVGWRGVCSSVISLFTPSCVSIYTGYGRDPLLWEQWDLPAALPP